MRGQGHRDVVREEAVDLFGRPQRRQQRKSKLSENVSGTSLDSIAAATGMKPPRLYAAFGNKRVLYLDALARYWEVSLAATREALAGDRPLGEALMLAYEAALSIYFSGKGSARGCFVIGTAVTEAGEDAVIRNSVAAGLRMIDTDFEARFRTARERGELEHDADPAALGVLASATMHTIAIRARAGARRAELREVARKAVSVICGCRVEAGKAATHSRVSNERK
jgi:AcrR family transcriptional regulator